MLLTKSIASKPCTEKSHTEISGTAETLPALLEIRPFEKLEQADKK